MQNSDRPQGSVSRRKFLISVAAAAGSSLLASCGSASDTSTAGTSAGATTAANTGPSGGSGQTVVWMSNQRHDQAVKAELFKQFEEQTGMKVEMQIFADEYPDQLKLAFESGNPPDIFNMNSPRLNVEAGWAEPLDDYLAKTPGLKESFLPGAFVKNRGIYNGKMYGLPMYAQTQRLYYNRSIFERAGLDPDKPPQTFSELREMARQITDALKNEGIYGFILGDKYPWVWWMNAEVPGNGAGYYRFDWKTGRFTIDHPGLKEAMQLQIAMQEDGSVFPGIHTLTDDDARQQFSLGKAGMIVGGSWNPGVFNDQFKSTEDWETAELPRPDGGAKGRLQQGIGDRYTISAQSNNKDAAWEVMKFMYSVRTMTTMYERGMGVMGVAAANTGKSSVRGVAKLAPTEQDVILPPEPELPTITPDLATTLQLIWDDRGTTMDDKLAAIEKAYNDTFAQEVAAGKLKEEDFVIPDWDGISWQPQA